MKRVLTIDDAPSGGLRPVLLRLDPLHHPDLPGPHLLHPARAPESAASVLAASVRVELVLAGSVPVASAPVELVLAGLESESERSAKLEMLANSETMAKWEMLA